MRCWGTITVAYWVASLLLKKKMNEYIKLCHEMKQVGFVVDFAIKLKYKDRKKKPRKEKQTRIKLDIFINT